MRFYARSPQPALGSFWAALFAWAVFGLPPFFAMLSQGEFRQALLAAATMLPYLFPILLVWLVVLWPLYRNVPRSSVLWNPMICTACGCFAGTWIGVVAAFCVSAGHLSDDFAPAVLFYSFLLGGLPGGLSCLFASLTAPFFLAEARWRRVSNTAALTTDPI